MAVIINATTTTGLTTSADNSGVIQFQSNGANTVGISSTGYLTIGGNQQIYGPAFSAYNGGTQSISATTSTKINFPTEEYDTNNNFSNNRFTPTVAGYYQVNWSVSSSSVQTRLLTEVWKNGTAYARGSDISSAQAYSVSGSSIVYCNGSTDYLEIYAFFQSAANAGGNSVSTYFNGCMVRGA